jgi:hypothetical protein
VKWPSQIMRQRVEVTPLGEDLGDGPPPGQPYMLRCRIDWGTSLVRTGEGDDITVVGTLLCRPEENVPAIGAQVTVGGDTRTVFAVNPAFDPGGHVAGYQVMLR